jgi:hypothetical protein
MKRRAVITYFAHLHNGGTVTWEREEFLTAEEDRDGPGHNLATTPATGVTVNGCFYPFSSITHIDWKVEA